MPLGREPRQRIRSRPWQRVQGLDRRISCSHLTIATKSIFVSTTVGTGDLCHSVFQIGPLPSDTESTSNAVAIRPIASLATHQREHEPDQARLSLTDIECSTQGGARLMMKSRAKLAEHHSAQPGPATATATLLAYARPTVASDAIRRPASGAARSPENRSADSGTKLA